MVHARGLNQRYAPTRRLSCISPHGGAAKWPSPTLAIPSDTACLHGSNTQQKLRCQPKKRLYVFRSRDVFRNLVPDAKAAM
eukprot:6204206-Pleurochrysis_carterae.AAC.3